MTARSRSLSKLSRVSPRYARAHARDVHNAGKPSTSFDIAVGSRLNSHDSGCFHPTHAHAPAREGAMLICGIVPAACTWTRTVSVPC